MSKRALGHHWEARTPDEREEFIPLFGEPIERAFLGKIEPYGAQNVLVERTSFVQNFRSQPDSVIKRSSYEELVKKVRARLP